MEAKIGTKRRFSFKEDVYEIKEIIDELNISMKWTWTTGVCPHCKKKIENIIDHKFLKVEILAKENLETITKDDILIMGHTLDRRYMHIPIDDKAYNEILAKSIDFKKFMEVK